MLSEMERRKDLSNYLFPSEQHIKQYILIQKERYLPVVKGDASPLLMASRG